MAINYFQVKYSGPESPFGRLPGVSLWSLTSRLRGSDSDEGFVIPAQAGIQFSFCNHHKKIESPENH